MDAVEDEIDETTLDSAHGTVNGRRGAPRARSRVACQACNRRKVKCDVAQTEPPCSNCQRHEVQCVVAPRKKHRPRRKRHAASAHAGEDDPDVNREPSLQPYDRTPSSASPGDNGMGTEDPQLDTGDSREESVLPEDNSFASIGQARSQRQSIYDLCHPAIPQVAGAHLPPNLAARLSHKPHEVEFMRHQGVFTKLPEGVCDALIRCYFHHVHFYLPIVDAPAFLNQYHKHGSQNISGLLLWSMFLAAANFADMNVLESAGFSSRKAMKTAMYERAKCLYDVDRGTDKLTLIQSVILLGFWYSDLQDHTGAWYWIGIAISLAQSIGLHRAPRPASRSRQNLPARAHLTRRIWWTCLVRDRWVSFAKGRPMRIHSEDCDTPMPAMDDVLDELDAITSEARVKFIPVDFRALTEMWLRLVRVSDILGGIIRLHYRVQGPGAQAAEVDKFADDLQILAPKEYSLDDLSDNLSIQAHQNELFYHATMAILYRPYVLKHSTPLPPGADPLWKKHAIRRARDAASSINNLLQGLIELDAIKYLKPMIITAMIPAMQIHLADCRLPNTLIRGLARNKLQLCMLVVSNMRATYWSANVMYQLFERAQTLLSDADSSRPRPAKKTNTRQPPTLPTNDSQSVAFTEMPQLPPHSSQHEAEVTQTTQPPMVLNEQQDQFWFSISPQFSNVDHLLSPEFCLNQYEFPNTSSNFPAVMMYDQSLPLQAPLSEESMYNPLSF